MLSGAQWRELSKALNKSFPTYQFLEIFLREELEISLANISAPKGMSFVIYDLIQYTEAHNRTLELIEAARRNRPQQDSEFYSLAQDLRVVPQTDNLERMLNQANIAFDVATFRKKVAEIEGRVCRIEVQGQAEGTGFLVGPAAVMTNYHVVEDVINGTVSPDKLRMRFDYKLLDDGTEINSGTIHTLDLDSAWYVDQSSYSEIDKIAEPKPGDPAPDELDYIVLRTKVEAAKDEIGKMGNFDPEMESTRGFVDLPPADQAYDFEVNRVLFIVQHPQGNPMKITANTFRGTNDNKTRITYFNDTEKGSSGSACFNANWELVALHHSGDPDYEQPEFNEGIPMHAIVNLLKDRGKLQEIVPDP